MGIHTSVTVPHPRDEVFAWHARPGAIRRLMPASLGLRIVAESGSLRDGTAALALPGGLRWLSRHDPDAYRPGECFVDEVVRGRDPRSWPPTTVRWRHTHTFESTADGGTRSIDHIDTPVPAQALRPGLVYRHRQLIDDLAAHRRTRAMPDRPSAVAILDHTGIAAVAPVLDAYLSTGGIDTVSLDPDEWVGTETIGTADALVILAGDADTISAWVQHLSGPHSLSPRTVVTVAPAGSSPPRLPAGIRHVHLATGLVVSAATLTRVARSAIPLPRTRGTGAAGWIDIDDLLDAIGEALADPGFGRRHGGEHETGDTAVITATATQPVPDTAHAGVAHIDATHTDATRAAATDALPGAVPLADTGFTFRRASLADAARHQAALVTHDDRYTDRR